VLGLLLAAGRGGRFDAHSRTSKLLSPLADACSFELALLALKTAVPDCVCVLPAVQSRLAGHANPVHVAQLVQLAIKHQVPYFLAPQAHLGMGESLAWATAQLMRKKSSSQGLMVHLADMPWVQSTTMSALVAACDAPDAIAAPSYQGQRGNPVAFGSAVWPAMLGLRADQGARKWITDAQAQGRLRLIDCDDQGILRDIDTPTDLPSSHGHQTHHS
jgi:molybdenum cofactor cytidylyltransferase